MKKIVFMILLMAFVLSLFTMAAILVSAEVVTDVYTLDPGKVIKLTKASDKNFEAKVVSEIGYSFTASCPNDQRPTPAVPVNTPSLAGRYPGNNWTPHRTSP